MSVSRNLSLLPRHAARIQRRADLNAKGAHVRTVADNLASPRRRYLWLYIIVLKGFLVYVSDIFTAVTMLSTDSWSNAIFNSCSADVHNGCVAIPFKIGKWLFFGCIIFSFLLVRL